MNAINDEVIDFLADHLLFDKISRQDIVKLAQFTEVRQQVPMGETIYREGERADSFLIVMRGALEIVKVGEDGEEHRLIRLDAGRSIGEIALLDHAPRSATVRTLEPSDLIVFDLEKCYEHESADEKPQTRMRLNLAREVSQRLRHTSDVTVTALEKSLNESRSREELSRFVTIVLITTCGYIFSLGMLDAAKEYLGDTRFLSIGVMFGFIVGVLIFITKSRMPLSAFGITTRNWRRSVWESLIFSVVMAVAGILIKYLVLQSVPGLEDNPVLEFSYNIPYSGFILVLAVLVYSVLVPLQELAVRGGLQTSLQMFLTGKYRVFFAILLSNLLFSAGHVYINMGLALTVFPIGLLWGWLYYRHGTLIGVCISHVLLGNFFFIVVGANSFSGGG